MGTGYVGLVTGLCLAELGHDVTCLDVVEEKVASINRGVNPLYEEGLDELLERHLNERFIASTDLSMAKDTDVTFICVGTPSREDGSLDLTYLKEAARELGEIIAKKEGHHLVVVKSTVMPGTTEDVVTPILENSSGRIVGEGLGVAMNPEFLREGTAVRDFMEPDRVVIGASDKRSREILGEIFGGFDCPVLEVGVSAAEMIKVASNAFLATKISFINEIGNLCKDMGIDVRDVVRGMGHDSRISPKFLRAGCGFGGSCFPKDVRGLAAESRRRGMEPIMLDALLKVNELQPERLVQLLESRMDVMGAGISVMGLAFKPGTDDIRESRAIPLVRLLLERGADVHCYDPKATEGFRRLFPQVTYHQSPEECVESSDAVVIVTEWPEFGDPGLYGDRLVIDGRGVVRTTNYDGICW